MNKWLINNKFIIIGVLLGAIAGFLYWKQIGCTSGTCLITSKWHNSTAYGAIMGGLLFSMLKKSPLADSKMKEKENESN